ncbi:hypothetical protein B0H21DRAFT_723328 [Amylocystis lapponica]|nr:hypothetical protein B0H21DRAFT_723328 [Amylocystis lapponica]
MEDDRMDDVSMDSSNAPGQFTFQQRNYQAPAPADEESVLTQMDRLYQEMRALIASGAQIRDFRDIPVKIHIRRPERDLQGQHSRVVVKAASSHKTIITFGEDASLVAEKRGNFVVIGCVEGGALNNSETLRLLACIDLACYACRQAVTDPGMHKSHRRRIARLIKDDRKRRHKRRREQDAMVDAFARTALDNRQTEPLVAPDPFAQAPLPMQEPTIAEPQPLLFPQAQF